MTTAERTVLVAASDRSESTRYHAERGETMFPHCGNLQLDLERIPLSEARERDLERCQTCEFAEGFDVDADADSDADDSAQRLVADGGEARIEPEGLEHHGGRRAGLRKEIHFDARDHEPRDVPESWRKVRHEPVEQERGEARWFAVAIERGAGVKALVDPHEDEVVDELDRWPAFRVTYVREDAARSFQLELRAERKPSGWLPLREEWSASVGKIIGYGREVDGDEHETYVDALARLYDVDATARDVGGPA